MIKYKNNQNFKYPNSQLNKLQRGNIHVVPFIVSPQCIHVSALENMSIPIKINIKERQSSLYIVNIYSFESIILEFKVPTHFCYMQMHSSMKFQMSLQINYIRYFMERYFNNRLFATIRFTKHFFQSESSTGKTVFSQPISALIIYFAAHICRNVSLQYISIMYAIYMYMLNSNNYSSKNL